MARIDNLTNFLTDIANSIRAKKGTTDVIPASNFDTEIASIETGSTPNLQSKSITITENGTQTITPDEGYDGLRDVDITTNVPTGEEPTIGFIVDEWNSEGYATKITAIGFSTIPSYAFASYNTSSQNLITKYLKSINLPNSSITIGSSAFFNCTNLESVNLPNNLKTIAGSTFYNCSKLLLSKLPDSLTTLGQNTFYGCSLIDFDSFPIGVTSIPYQCFYNCTNLSISDLGDYITTIGQWGFRSCTNLAITKLPNNLTTLELGGFLSCSKLSIKKIPDSLTVITSNAFGNCTSINQISMNNVTAIQTSGVYGGFYNCTGLKSAWIGSAITSSGFNRYAFNGCTNLTKMFIDLPRETVEAFTNYQYAFMNDTTKTGIIVCNDDEGFITKDEFDAIDWSSYTE